MTPKPQKNATIWQLCDVCNSYVPNRNKDLHSSNCNQKYNWAYPTIKDEVLYSSFEIKENEEIPGLSSQEIDRFVFLSQSVLQICDFRMGEEVIFTLYNDSGDVVDCCIRTIWPTLEKTVSSILVTRSGMLKSYSKNASVSKIPSESIRIVQSVMLRSKNVPTNINVTPDLLKRIHRNYMKKSFFSNNNFFITYYGKLLIFEVHEITLSEDEQQNNDILSKNMENLTVKDKVYKINEKTKILMKEKKSEEKIVIGLEKQENQVFEIMNLVLKKKNTLTHTNLLQSVILYGFPGTGKSAFIQRIKTQIQTNVHVVEINGLNVYSSEKAEDNLKGFFDEALENVPSLITIDDIDILCPNRSSRTSDQEKRITLTMIKYLEMIHDTRSKVFILAATNKLDSVDASLRRYGRIDFEIEIPVPNETVRKEFLSHMLKQSQYNLSDPELLKLIGLTPGFVGSDLQLLFSTAILNLQKRESKELELIDFQVALRNVKPTAMKDAAIESPNVLWSDIGGQKDLKLKLRQALEWPLTHPECFERMGVTPPRGVLMYGPPGCSKTMIAKAIATEGRFSFLSIKGPELFNKYVGESERAVRDLFKKARQVSPAIVFFDEIDAISGERSISGSSNSVQERVLAQLLTELDGVTALGNVIVVAATNRPDRIDKALLRPGRLDRIVYVPLPDRDTRKDIFEIKMRNMPVVSVDVDCLVERTEGYSGAEIQAVCNEAAMKALEESMDASEICMRHFLDALVLVSPRTPGSLLKIYGEYSNI